MQIVIILHASFRFDTELQCTLQWWLQTKPYPDFLYIFSEYIYSHTYILLKNKLLGSIC